MSMCFKCYFGEYHFFHDNGVPVTGRFRAEPKCQKCLDGDIHTQHDQKAYDQNRYYRES